MGRRRRRRHSAEFKAAVIADCMRPGVSIAAVAMTHSLNANMLRKWVIDAEQLAGTAPRAATTPAAESQAVPSTFIPLALAAPPIEGDIRIELQRSGTTINIAWPAAAATDCAVWLSGWLR